MNTLASKSGSRQRILNPRAIVIVSVVFVTIYFGARKLHDRQFGKTVEFLRKSAYESLDSQDHHKAHQQLSQYLAFRSSDLDAREKLSSLLSKQIGTRPALEQAFQLNEELLRNELPQVELRLEQARIAVQLGKYSDAEAHLRLLQFSCENNAEVWYLSGHCANEQRKMADAARCLQRAIECPDPPEKAFYELATLAEANPQLSLNSSEILDQMTDKCRSAESFRLQSMILVNKHDAVSALPLVWKGLEISPDDIRLNAMLVHCLQTNDTSRNTAIEIDTNKELKRAIPHLQGCIERNPTVDAFRQHLASLLWKDHQESTAILVLESGIARNAHAFELQSMLIEYLLAQQKIDRAERLLHDLPTAALPKAELELLMGRIEMIRSNWKAADKSFQKAIAYSQPDSNLQQRAQMLLAMCRANSGNASTAVDAFRAVLTANPNSISGQLGMASAWLKSGRTDLAIAEYRQLLDVPGVPAYLADLLIQRNLKQPAGLRDWNEVANLVRDQNPLITDPSQRTLLQADMLMASGRISEAIVLLESSHAENPDNDALERALARLNGEQNGRLQQRLQALATDLPGNHDVQAALIRLELGASRAESALQMLDRIASGQQVPEFTPVESLRLAIQTAETVTTLETLRGRTTYLELLTEATRRYAFELAARDANHEPTLVRVLAEQGRTKEAFAHIRSIRDSEDHTVKATALMALAEYATPRAAVLDDVLTELFTLIQSDPSSAALRICYADGLLYGDHFETATQVLEQIQDSPPENGDVQARLAWISAVESNDFRKARDLIAEAVSKQPDNPIFRVIEGRALIAAGEYREALAVLAKVDELHLSRAVFTYRAVAQLELGDSGEAWRTLEQIRLRNIADPLFPADERLLESVRNRLNQITTASRTQP